jgi:hypothetical protein
LITELALQGLVLARTCGRAFNIDMYLKNSSASSPYIGSYYDLYDLLPSLDTVALSGIVRNFPR